MMHRSLMYSVSRQIATRREMHFCPDIAVRFRV